MIQSNFGVIIRRGALGSERMFARVLLLMALCGILCRGFNSRFMARSHSRLPSTCTRRHLMASTKVEAVAGGSSGAAPKEKKKKEVSKYSATVLLPQTNFQQRANSVKREPEIQALWKEMAVYEKLSESNKGEKFILHDGPPYANGDLHIGHALNKILKDFINKYQSLRGKKVRYVPGWDCHGLPIELKVLQSMKSKEREALTPIKLRKKAAEFAKETMSKQRESFKRYGVWGHWDEPYMTLQPAYEAAQIRVFGQMVEAGHIYRGKKPVHWSPSSRTALAEAELEYPENHTSKSIYLGFKVATASPSLQSVIENSSGGSKEDVRVAIWTTTPWTIPANLAVAINTQIEYCIASHPSVHNNANFIVAKDLAAALGQRMGLAEGESLSINGVFKGDILVDTSKSYLPPGPPPAPAIFLFLYYHMYPSITILLTMTLLHLLFHDSLSTPPL